MCFTYYLLIGNLIVLITSPQATAGCRNVAGSLRTIQATRTLVTDSLSQCGPSLFCPDIYLWNFSEESVKSSVRIGPAFSLLPRPVLLFLSEDLSKLFDAGSRSHRRTNNRHVRNENMFCNSFRTVNTVFRNLFSWKNI